MRYRSRLGDNLLRESKAYGYTLSVWGVGALLIGRLGVPTTLEIVAYVGGAVTGFALLVVVAFAVPDHEDGLRSAVERDRDHTELVVSTVHVVATVGTLLTARGLVVVLARLPQAALFFLVGVQVTVAYNLLLLIEDVLARRVV